MSTLPRPRIRTPSRERCEQILSRNHVGGIACAWKKQMDTEPPHYVFEEGWLYGRTSREPG